MTRTTAVLGAACVALLGAVTQAAAGPPGGPACGDTVSGTVRLTQDLVCTDVGLTLLPGTVLDLRGHALVGPGRDVGGVALDVSFADVQNDPPVTVRNGTVRGWATVFPMSSMLTATLRRVVVQDNAVVADLVSSRLTFERSVFRDNGLVVGGFSNFADVTRSQFEDNATALSIGPPGGAVVRQSAFARNGTALSCSEGDITVTSSVFRKNTTAITADLCLSSIDLSAFHDNGTAFRSRMIVPDGSPGTDRVARSLFVGNDVAVHAGVRTVVEDNVFRRNGTGLISQSAGTPFEVEDVTVQGNVLTRNGDGVVVDTASHVGNNTATRNDGYGLFVPLATDLGGNTASRNGVDCVGVVCSRS
ncbi:right-handed parallel beta-helix repeat-containing protein [Cellulomonas sp. P5_C5]